MHHSAWNFNKEILFGECGAFLMANLTTAIVSHFTKSPTAISAFAVAGTLAGGALFWLAARIYDHVRMKEFKAAEIASDIGYFTPAAVILGFAVYDPAIYLISHWLLVHSYQAQLSVLLGQIAAFSLFLGSMNIYRALLLKYRGKGL